MKSCLTLLFLAAYAGTALAQYKCTAANGAITFQQTPCFGAKSEEKLVVIPNGHPAPASAPVGKVGTSIDERMLADYERQHQRDPLAQALKWAQDEARGRAAQRLADIDAAQRQFGDDPTNSQTLNNALTDIDSRYQAMSEIDGRRIKAAQAALDDWDKAQAQAAARK